MQPLDLVSRYDPPDFASGQEQRQADHERQICDRDAKAAQIALRCNEWSDLDKVAVACKLLSECVDGRDAWLPEGTIPRRLIDGYGVLDSIFRDMQDKEADDATD